MRACEPVVPVPGSAFCVRVPARVFSVLGSGPRSVRTRRAQNRTRTGTRTQNPEPGTQNDSSPFESSLIRDDLARKDICIEVHRPVALRADFDVMASWCQAQRL